MNTGNRKKVEKARSAVLQRLAGNTSKKNGVILPKGCSPSGRPLSDQVISRIKNQKYNPVTKVCCCCSEFYLLSSLLVVFLFCVCTHGG